MQYEVTLSSAPVETFRCIKAANSVDLDLSKKLTHHLSIDIDLNAPYNVGLIVGASGAGKTTLATQMFGEDASKPMLDLSRPIIEQFPSAMTYEECVAALNGSGLSQVPCWVRPAHTLSNGQRARAEIALQLCSEKEVIVIDEFTSVVDRTIAKIMSSTVQKMARRTGKKVILLSCHYDILDWLNPCWIVDCNKQEYTDRRAFFLNTKGKKDFSSTSGNVNVSNGVILANIII